MFPLSPASDWSLEIILKIDLHVPGIAGHFLRASDERKQVICAFLASRELVGAELTEVSGLLLRADHSTILREAFGDVPRGLRGALSRSGGSPHPADYYRSLYRILADPAKSNVAGFIQRLTTVSDQKLRIAEMLPHDLRHPTIIERLHDVERARDLVIVVGLIESAGQSRSEFIHALRVSNDDAFKTVVGRWALRLAFPAPPIPASNGYRPIQTGVELRRAAREYRNCMRGYFGESLDGRCAFGELDAEGTRVLVQLERRNGLWTYSGSFGFRNRPLSREIMDIAAGFVGRHGIPERHKQSKRDRSLLALQRLGGSPRSWW